jgi:DNA-binding NarL/FixJ family response regulator
MRDAVHVAVARDVDLVDASRVEGDPSNRIDLVLVASGSDWSDQRSGVAGHPVVVLAERRDDDDEYDAIERGALGYLALEAPTVTVRRALLAAIDGETVFGRKALGRWLRAHNRELTHASRIGNARVTARQRQILMLVAEGATTKDIAARLGVANSTVDKHVSLLLKRVGAPNRAAAVGLYALADRRLRHRPEDSPHR